MSPNTPASSTSNDQPVARADPWEMVESHDEMIRGIVGVAIARGLLHSQDRDERISDAKMLAYQLAIQYDPARGEFECYLAHTLSRRLFDEVRETSDASAVSEGTQQ